MKLRKKVAGLCREWLAEWTRKQLDDVEDMDDGCSNRDHPDLPGDVSYGEFYETMAQAQWPEGDTGRHLSTRRMLLPKNTNPHGHIFGGTVLSEIDLAGAIEARRHTKHEVATKYMNGVQFDAPIIMGEVVTLYTTLVKKGRTSLTIKVEVECSRDGESAPAAVTATEVVYVAIKRLPGGGITKVALDEE